MQVAVTCEPLPQSVTRSLWPRHRTSDHGLLVSDVAINGGEQVRRQRQMDRGRVRRRSAATSFFCTGY